MFSSFRSVYSGTRRRANRRCWRPRTNACAGASTEDKGGLIEIMLPNGARVSVDAFVNEKALARVLRAMKGRRDQPRAWHEGISRVPSD